jgi:hypothetical protein
MAVEVYQPFPSPPAGNLGGSGGDQSCLPHSRRHHDVPGALRRYERQAIPKANVVSWLAGTEATNRYEPRRTKLMPNH